MSTQNEINCIQQDNALKFHIRGIFKQCGKGFFKRNFEGLFKNIENAEFLVSEICFSQESWWRFFIVI